MLSLAWIAAIAIALGADAFSLSLAIGLTGISKRLVIHLSAVVSLFHIVMPLGGMILGQTLGSILGRFASGIGALILIGLGGRILYKIFRPAKEYFSFEEARRAFSNKNTFRNLSLSGWGVYALGASVSLDALSVGFSLGTLKTDIFLTVMVIGLVAGLMTGWGLILGRIIGTRLGDKAEMFGGLALFLIGIKLFF
jgi:putative Mn2+ efflux pump MntP